MAKQISWRRLKHYWPLYGFVLPSAILVALFRYYTAGSAVYHAFYRWNGDYINRYVGMEHFNRALGTPWMWIASLTVILAVIYSARARTGSLLRFVAGIAVPAASVFMLARLSQPDWQPAERLTALLAAALLWGIPVLGMIFFGDRYNPARSGQLLLLCTGAAGHMLSLCGLDPLMAWTAAITAAGVLLHASRALRTNPAARGWQLTQALAGMGLVVCALGTHAGGDRILWQGFSVIAVLVAFNIVKMLPSIVTAVVIHRLKSDRANYWYRVLFVIPMIIPGMVYLLLWKFFYQPESAFNLILSHTGLLDLLTWLDRTMNWGGVFAAGNPPVWLGHEKLVLPAMILWGFPWVGVVGVLIYLAGLQSIDKSVYEAADVDGISSLGKFWHIELPLILTQVRINLILMVIGTLQSYEHILILFGDGGGPNGRLLIPGLYMFRNAFALGEAGYACCIGLIVFVFILILTEVNNRFVRVDK